MGYALDYNEFFRDLNVSLNDIHMTIVYEYCVVNYSISVSSMKLGKSSMLKLNSEPHLFHM